MNSSQDLYDRFRIHDEAATARFLESWNGQFSWIRAEYLPLNGSTALFMDLILSGPTGILPVLAIPVVDGIPQLPAPWDRHPWGLSIVDAIQAQQAKGSFLQYELRMLAPSAIPSREALQATFGLPGIWDYASLGQRLSLHAHATEIASTAPVACWSLDPFSLPYLDRLLPETSIHRIALDTHTDVPIFRKPSRAQAATPDRFLTVFSAGILESISDPHLHITNSQRYLDPDGRLIVSVLSEDRKHTAMEAPQRSLWNRSRLERLLCQHFSDVEIVTKPALLNTGTQVLVGTGQKPRRRMRPSVMVRRDYAIGDVLWTTPIVRQLRQDRPEAEVSVATRCLDIYRASADADLVLSTESALPSPETLLDLDNAYEQRRGIHLLDAYSQVAQIHPTRHDPLFQPRASDLETTGALLRRRLSTDTAHLVAFHMAASSPDRIWPATSWKALHNLLSNHSVAVVLLGSGKDFDSRTLGLEDSPRLLDLVSKMDLSGTGAVLSWCDLVVGPDSGLSHLAPAVGTSPLVLHNMAVPNTRLPFKIPHRSLWVESPCRGCLEQIPAGHPVACRYGQSDCMETIRPELVAETLVSMLNAIPPGSWLRRLDAGNHRESPCDLLPSPAIKPRWQDHRFLAPVRNLVRLVRNVRNQAVWIDRQSFRS